MAGSSTIASTVGTVAAAEVSRAIWASRYRAPGERTIEDTWRRVARALASVEPGGRKVWEERFLGALRGFAFLPGGRILAGAGTGRRVTLCNCFVMGVIEDSLDGIFEALKEGALTMQQGGGVGYDFSTLRPAGTPAAGAGTIASGPVSFLRVWDSMCATVLSTGARRGAMMATLRCDHPDVLAFVDAKVEPGALTRFNLSVQVTDDLMTAVRRGDDWPLIFPAAPGEGGTVLRHWTGAPGPVPCQVVRTLPARELWGRLVRAAWERAEPGVLFVDRVNRANNLWYRERITATNPCGELPLPPYGACVLGSLNLTRFVAGPFGPASRLDLEGIAATAALAVRMLDDALELSRFPLPAQRQQARGSRRIGLGITGLADALAMLGLPYASAAARQAAATVLRTIGRSACRASVELAREKGSFPFFDRDRYLAGERVSTLPEDIRAGIARHGIRNSHLTAIAPTGTVSLLAGNVSSGLEPLFDLDFRRRVLDQEGEPRELALTDYAVALWRDLHRGEEPPAGLFARAHEVPPEDHLEMQAALQPWVDSAIAKTVHLPEDLPFERFARLYELAWEKGLKGCTTFRPNPVTGEVLRRSGPSGAAAHCCAIEREAD